MRLAQVELREEARRWGGAPLLEEALRRTWIVRLSTDCGRVAEGEVAWLPRAGETLDVPALVATWAWGWLGRALPDPEDDPALPPPVAWAITMALAELRGRLWPPGPIDENGLLHALGDDPLAVGRAWSAQLRAQPAVRTWKVKVGRGAFDVDAARLRALELPAGVQLRLDPNRGWGALRPEAVAAALAGLPIAYLEEPVGWPALAEWAAAGLPCAADESVLDVSIDALADAGVVAVVLKPSVIGGLGAVLQKVRAARARGLGVVVSSALEGPVGRRHLEALVGLLPAPRSAAGLARDALVDPPVESVARDCWRVDSDPLRRAAVAHPDAVALEADDERLTFAAWDRAADRVAARLGDRRGERLVVEIDGPDGAARLFGVLRAGAVACLVPPGVQRDAAVAQVGAVEADAGRGAPPGIAVDRPATLLWSSGSTGAPRAIAHSLGQHLSSAAASHVRTPFGVGDRWVAALRLHHIGGLALLFRALHAGGTVVFQGERALEALQPTHLSWVPTQLLRAPERPPPGLRHLLLGGAAAPPELVRRRRASGWPVQTTYGSTELASQVCTSAVHGDPAASGAPLPGRAVQAAPQIRVRGTTVCLGVWSEGGIQPLAGSDGWLVTGDVGELGTDGALRVLGRADSMFISGGENVFPEAIERVLGAHPAVRAVVVVDVPDAVWGARPWAFVDGTLSLDEARSYLSARLPRPAWVDRVLPWEAGGVGATGKPRRAWFRARARGLHAAEAGGR